MYCIHCAATLTDTQHTNCLDCEPVLVSRTAKNIDINTVQYANIWSRLSSFIIDGLILSAILFLVLLVLILTGYRPRPPGIIVLTMILFWFYFIFQESSTTQSTFGKRIIKLKIIAIDGAALSVFRSTLRSLLIASTLGLGFIVPILNKKRQNIYDLLTKTVVINNRKIQ